MAYLVLLFDSTSAFGSLQTGLNCTRCEICIAKTCKSLLLETRVWRDFSTCSAFPLIHLCENAGRGTKLLVLNVGLGQ